MESIEDTHLKGKPTQPHVDMLSPVKQTEDQAMYQIKSGKKEKNSFGKITTEEETSENSSEKVKEEEKAAFV